MRSIIIISALLMGALISGCSTSVPQRLDPDVYYKRDMTIDMNGFKGHGTLVVPMAKNYKIEVKAKGDLDLFTFNTCHREWTKEEAFSKGGWFHREKRKFRIEYKPIEGLETGLACPAQFGGFEREGGRHSWAHVDFEDDGATLPALVSCNGQRYNSRGVTVCQSKNGLIQEIKFPVKVVNSKITTKAQGGLVCPVLSIGKDGMTVRYKMPRRECVYRFGELGGEKRMHRLTTIGYEKILIRTN